MPGLANYANLTILSLSSFSLLLFLFLLVCVSRSHSQVSNKNYFVSFTIKTINLATEMSMHNVPRGNLSTDARTKGQQPLD